MNLASASLRELRVAFGVDARSFLEQFDSALRGEAATPDPRVGAAAGEALRGLRIGAEFLGLRSLAQLCREVERELLAPRGAPPDAAGANAMRVRQLAQALHQALGDLLASAPQDQPEASPSRQPVAAGPGAATTQPVAGQLERPQAPGNEAWWTLAAEPVIAPPAAGRRGQESSPGAAIVETVPQHQQRRHEQARHEHEQGPTRPQESRDGPWVEDTRVAAGPFEPPPQPDASQALAANEGVTEPVAARHTAAEDVVAVAEEPVAEDLTAEDLTAEEIRHEQPLAPCGDGDEVALWQLAAAHAVADEFVVEEIGVEEIGVEESVAGEVVSAEPWAEKPVSEEAVAEAPGVEDVVAEDAVVEEAVSEEPVSEEAVVQASVVEEAVAEEPVSEEAVVEEAVVEEAVVEEAVVEEPVAEEPVSEDAVVEAAVIEESVIEESVAEVPVAEEPAVAEIAAGKAPAAGSVVEPVRAELPRALPEPPELAVDGNRVAAPQPRTRQEELAMLPQVEEFAPVLDEAVPGEPVQPVLERPLVAQPGEPDAPPPAATGAGPGPLPPPASPSQTGRACRWDLADASRLLHDAVAPLQGSLQQTQDLLRDQQQGWQRLREELLQALAAAIPPPREQPAAAIASDARGADAPVPTVAPREADAPPAWDGVLQVHPARLGEWTVALPSQCVLGQLRQPRGLRLPRGDSLVLSELGALPDVGLEAPWQLEPDPLGADEYLLVGDHQAAYALRVQSCLEPRALHFWSLPVVLGAPLGVAAAAVLDRPALAAGESPRASDLVLLLDPGFIAAQHAAARDAAAGAAEVEPGAARGAPA